MLGGGGRQGGPAAAGGPGASWRRRRTSGDLPLHPPKQPFLVRSLQWLTMASRQAFMRSGWMFSWLQKVAEGSRTGMRRVSNVDCQAAAACSALPAALLPPLCAAAWHQVLAELKLACAAPRVAESWACAQRGAHWRQTGSITIATRRSRSWLAVGGKEGGLRGAHHLSASSCSGSNRKGDGSAGALHL
jgi:hypothetical protein